MGGLIGGLIGLGGSALSAALAAKEAKKQRDWQEGMYKTRYQNTMADMREAGLNPILAYQQGVGNVGAGATAQVPDFGSSMARGASAGLAAQSKKSEIDAIEQGTATGKALEDKHASETAINIARQPYEQALGDFFRAMPEAATLQKVLGLAGGAAGLAGAYKTMRMGKKAAPKRLGKAPGKPSPLNLKPKDNRASRARAFDKQMQERTRRNRGGR